MNFKPLIIAHRGFSGLYPENTVKSVAEAINIGADLIEFDLQLTKDNEVVVFHDRTVERIIKSEKNKSIADFTLDELKKKDFGSWFNSTFSNVQIATLRDIMEVKISSKNKFDFIIEIKGLDPEELIPRVKNIIDEYNYTFTKGYLSVRDEIAFEIARKNNFQNKYIGLMQKKRTPVESMDLAKELNAGALQLRPKNWNDEDWLNLQKSNLRYTIFYADTVEDFKKYIEKNPYGIFTNFPNKLKDFLAKNN